MYKIQNIPKPDKLPTRRAGESKYPFGDMEVGSSFVVPYEDMNKGETPLKFRERVHKSAREWSRRDYNSSMREANNLSSTITRKEFTVALMTEDAEGNNKGAYTAGDVVVWRDK